MPTKRKERELKIKKTANRRRRGRSGTCFTGGRKENGVDFWKNFRGTTEAMMVSQKRPFEEEGGPK